MDGSEQQKLQKFVKRLKAYKYAIIFLDELHN